MIQMSLHAYITFLMKRFYKRYDEDIPTNQLETVSNKWFGVLPFMLKWLTIEAKK